MAPSCTESRSRETTTRLVRRHRFTALALLGALLVFSSASVRPVRDTIGFCWDAAQFTRLHDFIKNQAGDPVRPDTQWCGGISPHDDYLYAGPVYYHLFSALKGREALLFGVTHRSVRRALDNPEDSIIFDTYPNWRGPFGRVKITDLRERLRAILPEVNRITSNHAHELEHSLEALIPWLQIYNRNLAVTPLMITPASFERMEDMAAALADEITRYLRETGKRLGDDFIFVISADANHYGSDFDNTPFGVDAAAHTRATSLDRQLVRAYLTGPITRRKLRQLSISLTPDETDSAPLWCGRYSIPFGLLTMVKVAERLPGQPALTGQLLEYSDTYTAGVLPLPKPGCGITAPFSLSHWVGFFSVAFSLEQQKAN